MAEPKSRVLIVDDSAITRRLLAGALREDPAIEVVAQAADAFTANALIGQHRPDIITLDLEMPQMDGLAFLHHLMRHNPIPVIVVSSYTRAGSALTIEALQAGAVDVIPKPQNPLAVAPFARRLRQRIKDLAQCSVRLRPARDGVEVARSVSKQPVVGRPINAIIAIGASTGGPPAIESVLAHMPADAPPIVIVQHMPPSFTRMFAERLNQTCALQVVEALHQQDLSPGLAVVAPGDNHLTIERQGIRLRAAVTRGPSTNHQRPSVDVLFQSLTKVGGVPVIAVLLTGMGNDGAEGMVALARAGHETIAEDETSCVVFGMPREAITRGGAKHVLPLGQIPAMILECLNRLESRARAAAST